MENTKEIKTTELPIYATRLKELRLEKNLSQDFIAKVLKISSNAIYRYESGKSEPPLKALVYYAVSNNVTIDWILGLTDKKDNKPEVVEKIVEVKKENYLEEFRAWLKDLPNDDEDIEYIASLVLRSYKEDYEKNKATEIKEVKEERKEGFFRRLLRKFKEGEQDV